MSTKRLILVALLLLPVMACQRTGARAEPTASLAPVLGSVDMPRPGEEQRGPIGRAGGWALAEEGIASVAIYLDGDFVDFASLGGSRPDVAAAFPATAAAGASGWNVTFDLAGTFEGRHQLVVRIRTRNGREQSLPAVPFEVVHAAR